MVEKVQKSEKEWRDQLTPEQHRVARERETEKRFSHPEHNAKVTGVYHCVCCGAPLFKASTKFDS
ncbi:MAG: peptide-methionine (R)-S-oxide reductase, partial [Pseudomonadota bacterium]|nr:peptide-methionine (R)-S-oxide reductase [Pseudomonadota bacterium]